MRAAVGPWKPGGGGGGSAGISAYPAPGRGSSDCFASKQPSVNDTDIESDKKIWKFFSDSHELGRRIQLSSDRATVTT